MKKAIVLLSIVIFLLSGCAVIAAIMRPTVDSVANTAVSQYFAPDPLADVLAVREQAQNNSAKYGWLLAGLLIIGLAGAGILIGMGRLSKLLNAFKRLNRPRRQLQPPALPYQELPSIPPVQRVPPAPALPDWTDGTYE